MVRRGKRDSDGTCGLGNGITKVDLKFWISHFSFKIRFGKTAGHKFAKNLCLFLNLLIFKINFQNYYYYYYIFLSNKQFKNIIAITILNIT